MSEAAIALVSRADYLEYERDGRVRHEWVGGQMFMMTGGSGRHNRISLRLASVLMPLADTHGCRVFVADMKVVSGTFGYYPDIMVVCEGDAPGTHHEEHPCLIAEVLSPTTQDRDRREKWAAYKTISALRHYVLIRQDDMQVEHRYRSSEDAPWQHEILGPDDILAVSCPNATITVSSLYVGLGMTA
jgi:Uma2 family endonuclease